MSVYACKPISLCLVLYYYGIAFRIIQPNQMVNHIDLIWVLHVTMNTAVRIALVRKYKLVASGARGVYKYPLHSLIRALDNVLSQERGNI